MCSLLPSVKTGISLTKQAQKAEPGTAVAETAAVDEGASGPPPSRRSTRWPLVPGEHASSRGVWQGNEVVVRGMLSVRSTACIESCLCRGRLDRLNR